MLTHMTLMSLMALRYNGRTRCGRLMRLARTAHGAYSELLLMFISHHPMTLCAVSQNVLFPIFAFINSEYKADKSAVRQPAERMLLFYIVRFHLSRVFLQFA
jgi:hypothetical protein